MCARMGSALAAAGLILAVAGGARAQHPQPTFARVVGAGVLRWDMSCEQAQAALVRRGVRPASEEMTGIFDRPGPPGTPGAAGGWAEIRFQKLHWTVAGREAHAECESYRLVSVRYVRRGLTTEALARAAARPLIGRYGPPTAEHDTEWAAHVWEWSNDTTRLSLIVVADPSSAGHWNVIEQWTPASRTRGW